ncbi:MAG: DNA polymerase Y family protein [Acidobacteriaceae bacterium]
MTKPAELYACLYAKEFPAQALLRLRLELRDKPCVVMKGEPPLEQVCSLNRKARIHGLLHGMTRVEVDTFSSVMVMPRSYKEEAATKAVLLEGAGAFSPRVQEQSEENAFLCVIDIAGTASLFGAPESLAKNLLGRVRTLGITACIAVSSNVPTAIALAKGLPPRTSMKIVSAGEEGAALAPLPIAVLDMAPHHAETLNLWGIRTLGMLAALPENELVARMGQAGKRLRQLARGEMPHLFQPIEPAFTLEEHMELDSPVEQLEALLFVVNVMIEQLILRAKARMFALASVHILLELERNATHARTVRPALPANDRQLWIKLIHLDLEAHPPQAAILALTVTAEPGSTSKVQLGLFSPQLPEPARLDVTLAHIRAIVGDENVGHPVLLDTHEPGAFKVEPFTVPSGSSAVIPSHPSRSAMRTIRPPEIVSVTVQSQRPKAFAFRGKHYSVEHTYGPWLVSGDWWQPTLWGFEEWDLVARAQDATPLFCCMMRDRIADSWHMAALYD